VTQDKEIPLEETQVVKAIEEIQKLRPTYGYRRITAMLRSKMGLICNKKRVYRLMRKHGLLLPKLGYPTREHTGTGKVATLHSNTRWASDCFEIKTFDDSKVYVGFTIDCCDREVISWIMSRTPICAEQITELYMASVWKRFGDYKTPRLIQMLTDRGKVYRAGITEKTCQMLGLLPCFTAAYSPSSNGIAEALVGTIKRDYAYVSDVFNQETTMEQIPNWFRDYNENAPHSALAMMSPMAYREKQLKSAG
jgi:putative transposase